ncbi:hypothetical protein NM688_g9109 [Phlebia brevispora]|uniref:Uncharacterized protein n=1 Tax=Phlebia brevispora TaxID=194682 RepID=A0ACC1RKS3_9APHY|nr:hypothetical protein NM688_g9109 [Phlebia brevispora]
MADIAGDCLGAFCALCCICCSDSLQNWCLFKHWGAGSSSSAGCCTSCCKRSFDDDDFEKEEARLHESALARERERDATAGPNGESKLRPSENTVVSTQPTAAKTMTQPKRSTDGRPSMQDPRA